MTVPHLKIESTADNSPIMTLQALYTPQIFSGGATAPRDHFETPDTNMMTYYCSGRGTSLHLFLTRDKK